MVRTASAEAHWQAASQTRAALGWPTWTKAVLPAVPRPSSLTMARVMRLSDLPPPPPLPLVSVVTPAAPPPLSYLRPHMGRSVSAMHQVC